VANIWGGGVSLCLVSCMHIIALGSGLSILDCLFGFLYIYVQCMCYKYYEATMPIHIPTTADLFCLCPRIYSAIGYYIYNDITYGMQQ